MSYYTLPRPDYESLYSQNGHFYYPNSSQNVPVTYNQTANIDVNINSAENSHQKGSAMTDNQYQESVDPNMSLYVSQRGRKKKTEDIKHIESMTELESECLAEKNKYNLRRKSSTELSEEDLRLRINQESLTSLYGKKNRSTELSEEDLRLRINQESLTSLYGKKNRSTELSEEDLRLRINQESLTSLYGKKNRSVSSLNAMNEIQRNQDILKNVTNPSQCQSEEADDSIRKHKKREISRKKTCNSTIELINLTSPASDIGSNAFNISDKRDAFTIDACHTLLSLKETTEQRKINSSTVLNQECIQDYGYSNILSQARSDPTLIEYSATANQAGNVPRGDHALDLRRRSNSHYYPTFPNNVHNRAARYGTFTQMSYAPPVYENPPSYPCGILNQPYNVANDFYSNPYTKDLYSAPPRAPGYMNNIYNPAVPVQVSNNRGRGGGRRGRGRQSPQISHRLSPREVSVAGEPPKRTRTIYTREEIEVLETSFNVNKYLTNEEKLRLAGLTNKSDQQIKVWFQNRRMRWRKHDPNAGAPQRGGGRGRKSQSARAVVTVDLESGASPPYSRTTQFQTLSPNQADEYPTIKTPIFSVAQVPNISYPSTATNVFGSIRGASYPTLYSHVNPSSKSMANCLPDKGNSLNGTTATSLPLNPYLSASSWNSYLPMYTSGGFTDSRINAGCKSLENIATALSQNSYQTSETSHLSSTILPQISYQKMCEASTSHLHSVPSSYSASYSNILQNNSENGAAINLYEAITPVPHQNTRNSSLGMYEAITPVPSQNLRNAPVTSMYESITPVPIQNFRNGPIKSMYESITPLPPQIIRNGSGKSIYEAITPVPSQQTGQSTPSSENSGTSTNGTLSSPPCLVVDLDLSNMKDSKRSEHEKKVENLSSGECDTLSSPINLDNKNGNLEENSPDIPVLSPSISIPDTQPSQFNCVYSQSVSSEPPNFIESKSIFDNDSSVSKDLQLIQRMVDSVDLSRSAANQVLPKAYEDKHISPSVQNSVCNEKDSNFSFLNGWGESSTIPQEPWKTASTSSACQEFDHSMNMSSSIIGTTQSNNSATSDMSNVLYDMNTTCSTTLLTNGSAASTSSAANMFSMSNIKSNMNSSAEPISTSPSTNILSNCYESSQIKNSNYNDQSKEEIKPLFITVQPWDKNLNNVPNYGTTLNSNENRISSNENQISSNENRNSMLLCVTSRVKTEPWDEFSTEGSYNYSLPLTSQQIPTSQANTSSFTSPNTHFDANTSVSCSEYPATYATNTALAQGYNHLSPRGT